MKRFFLSLRWSARCAVVALLISTGAGAVTPKPEAFDPNFNGIVNAVLVQPDGKIIMGGAFTGLHPGNVGSPALRGRLVRFHGDGSIDTTFAPIFSGPVKALALDADGNLLVGGGFAYVLDGDELIERHGLARLNPEGVVDRDFAAQFDGENAGRDAVAAIAVLADGTMVVGGTFRTVQTSADDAAVARPYLARLHADGSLVDDFQPELNNEVRVLAANTDGGFLAGGAFTTVGGHAAGRLARFDAAGDFDATFAVSFDNLVTALAVEVDGALLVGGDFITMRGADDLLDVTQLFLARVRPDGRRDRDFHPRPSARVTALAVEHTGSILVGGDFNSFLPFVSQSLTSAPRLARLNRAGEVDTSFGATPSATVKSIALQEDGAVVVGGLFTTVSDTITGTVVTRLFGVRMHENGRVEAAFSPGSSAALVEALERADGSILLAGSFINFGGATRTNLALISADGVLDESFAPEINGAVQTMVEQADGKIVIGGNFISLNDEDYYYLARLNADGTRDESYDPQPNGPVSTMLLEDDGSITVGGSFTGFTPDYDADTSPDDYEGVGQAYLARITAAGYVDESWQPITDGAIAAMARQPDGKTLIGGSFSGVGTETFSALARVLVDGKVDKDFGPLPNGVVRSIVVEDNGDILIGGDFTLLELDDEEGDDDDEDDITNDDADRLRLARLHADGSLDLAFRPAVDDSVLAMQVLADGDILVGGAFTRFVDLDTEEETVAAYLLRLNPDGTRDDGTVWQTNGSVESLLTLRDGRVLVLGTFGAIYSDDDRSVRTEPPVVVYGTESGVDIAWNTRADVDPDRYIGALTVQRSGQILAGGRFDGLAGSSWENVLRFTAQGSIDGSFALRADGAVHTLIDRVPSGIWDTLRSPVAWMAADGLDFAGANYAHLSALSGRVQSAARESDGSVLLGGYFTNTANTSGSNLVRLRVDGTFDPDFRPNPNSTVTEIALQPDGRIIIVGSFDDVDGVEENYIARLWPDGSVDTTFKAVPQSSISTVALQEDGKILIGGSFQYFDVDDGEEDDDDGDEATDDDTAQRYLARLNTDGTLDKSFVPVLNGYVGSIQVHPSGEISIGGEFTYLTISDTSTVRNGLARLTAEGLLVEDFDPSPNGTVWDLELQADGKLLVAGAFTGFDNLSDFQDDDDDGDGDTDDDGNDIADEDSDVYYLARLNVDGSLDLDFNPTPNATVREIALQADGALLVRGDFGAFFPDAAEYGIARRGVARVNVDGSVDARFNPNPDDEVYMMIELADDSILLGGDFESLGLEAVLYVGGAFDTLNDLAIPRLGRVQSDGSPDGNYAPTPDGDVHALVGTPDDRMIVAGAFTTLFGQTRARIARLEQDGSLDADFAPVVDGAVRAVAIDQNGGVLIGGDFTTVDGQPRAGLARLWSDGSLDPDWTPTVMGAVQSLAVLPDGRVVVAGELSAVNGLARTHLAVVSATGALDAEFAPTIDGAVHAVAVRADGRVTIGGAFGSVNGAASPRVATLDLNGALYAAGESGTNGTVYALAIDREGRLVAGGSFTRLGEVSRSLLGRTSIASSFGQTLLVDEDGRGLTWVQTGAAATPAAVKIAVSLDGEEWIERGLATRNGSYDTWRWSGAALPVGRDYYLRVRMITSGTRWASGSVREYQRLFQGTRSSGYGYGSTLPSRFGVIDGDLGDWLPGGEGIVVSGGRVVSGDDTGAGNPGEGDDEIDVLTSRLTNVSTRVALTGEDTLTVGFVVEGTSPRQLLLRGIGPGLVAFLDGGAMRYPELSLHDHTGATLATNSGWNGTSATRNLFAQAGAFALPGGSADAVITPVLAPGTYTLALSDRRDEGGTVLAEVYDLGSVRVTDHLSNLSTLGRIGAGAEAFVVGFVVEGSAPQRVLIRGAGPALLDLGVADASDDVTIDVRDVTGQVLARNDDWATPVAGGASPAAVAASAGAVGAFAFAEGSADAAVLIDLAPGVYTVMLGTKDDAPQRGLIEIYTVSP
ncbi:delta-60 repeat domain-containing protein [Synoicihabitans lomoniglobus]|uniref:Delta-60 repeat domain-containing protein n=1 Tax=Synoicihabitans lomoniglobus TaxID=2909285 RepID=A0AAE9ZVH4_9BACT|nr:delta-60 repeat domain-containing protein [Opitutaceae bacterium LMO-M01]WED63839.1 delta-60 repeat domain-containing protein [Opitutaceae bacterium LMO-M01]